MTNPRIGAMPFIAALASHSPVVAQDSAGAVESAIRALEEQERLAVLDEDVVALERLWASSFTVNNPQNAISPDRATVLDLVRGGLIRYSSFDRRIEAIRLYEDIVVTMGSETIARRLAAGDPAPAVERRFTHVWRRAGTTWELIARHANEVPGQ